MAPLMKKKRSARTRIFMKTLTLSHSNTNFEYHLKIIRFVVNTGKARKAKKRVSKKGKKKSSKKKVAKAAPKAKSTYYFFIFSFESSNQIQF